MDSSKYSQDARPQWKFDQRTPAYLDLQQRSAAARVQLERVLRDRNATIERLAARLRQAGVSAAEVASLQRL
jgi:hypothetical protein